MMRLHAYAVSLAIIGAVAYPAFVEPWEDDFPLSTYPMFARDRGRTAPVISALARGPGFERPVPPSFVANAEVMQALQTLRKSVQAGRRSSRALCRAIARRVAEADEADFANAEEIAIVTKQLDSIRFLAGEEAELSRRVHMRCRVEAVR